MEQASGRRPVVVPGFSFASASAGIKEEGRRDLALIYSEHTAVAAGVFTSNTIKAAPVKLAIGSITSHKARAIVINSGNANACTGEQGMKDAVETAEKTAEALGVQPDLVYVSSTGVIGRPLPVKKITNAVPELAAGLSPLSIDDAAAAIMTTDTFPKTAHRKIRIGGRTGTLAAIAKGSGMICPNMATMLCFIVTDIAVTPAALDSALKESVNASFNRLTVDNDMSTNDTVMIMANGALGNRPITKRSPLYRQFKDALNRVTYELSKMIARDGEGATKLIEIIVRGAATDPDAEKAAQAIAKSMLVKTAVYGKDPNWGRIIAAAGYSGAKLRENRLDIFLNRVKLVSGGTGTGRESEAAKLLSDKEINITVDLGAGSKTAKVLTCDLTEGYININAHYTT